MSSLLNGKCVTIVQKQTSNLDMNRKTNIGKRPRPDQSKTNSDRKKTSPKKDQKISRPTRNQFKTNDEHL